jgi:hypothetical protein
MRSFYSRINSTEPTPQLSNEIDIQKRAVLCFCILCIEIFRSQGFAKLFPGFSALPCFEMIHFTISLKWRGKQADSSGKRKKEFVENYHANFPFDAS